MNLVNRILAVFVMLLVFVISVASVAVALFWTQDFLQWAQVVIIYFATMGTDQLQRVLLVGGLAFGVISFVFLLIELTPRARRLVRLTQVTSGESMLTLDAVENHLRRELQTMPQVVEVRPRAKAKGKGVEVLLELSIPDSNISVNIEEILRLARATLEDSLGVEVKKLGAEVRLKQAAPASTPTPS